MEDRLDTIVRLNIEHYIARLNIEHFKKLLETDIDETKRQIMKRLLAEERIWLRQSQKRFFAKLKRPRPN
jgi:hypothetical protein